MRLLFATFVFILFATQLHAFDSKSVILCRHRGSDGQNRTFLIDLGASNLKTVSLAGDAIHNKDMSFGWEAILATSQLVIEKFSGKLHYRFAYENVKNMNSLTLGSGALNIEFSDDQKSVSDPEASCSIVEKSPDYNVSIFGLSCAINETESKWFIVSGAMTRELIRSSTRMLAANDLISKGSETARENSLTYAGTEGLAGHYTYMVADAGNIYDHIEKHYVPVNAKINAKTNILTSYKYPPQTSDIERKIPCIRRF